MEADGWIAAADVCLEISLAATADPLDRFRADALANAVRLRQTDHILEIIDGLGDTLSGR